MRLDEASKLKLDQVVAYLNEKSNKLLWARLYQKIIFLLELEHYKKHQRLSIGLHYKSYLYGPFSEEVALALENPKKIEVPQYVKAEVDKLLKQYHINNFDNESQEKIFKKIITHIHALKIYNMTPFEAQFDFSLYPFEDLFETIKSKLDGITLEREKYDYIKIEHEAKEYENLFE